MPRRHALLVLWLACLALPVLETVGRAAEAADEAPGPHPAGLLRWHKATKRVDADFSGWSLRTVLERVAGGSGWSVFVEPGLDSRVAARFKNRPEREALADLLADVNYALLPVTNGSSRLLVFRSGSSQATDPVKPPAPADDPHALKRELIVRLAKGTDVQALARRLGARVAGSIDGLNAHRLVFDDEASAEKARAQLANEPEVEAVESNYAVGAPSQMERLSGAPPPSVPLRARPISDGSSVVIALLDTSLGSSTGPHSDFLLPEVSVAGKGPSESGLSHGPAMFETILQGLALGETTATGQPVRVLPVDVYGGRSETSTFDLAMGVAAALERGADILNLSLSGPNPSPVLHDMLQQASAAGVVAFAAPGNEPTVAPNYPAAYPEVVAVTASDRNGQLASYANRGAFVDLIAPGTSIVPYQGDAWVVNGTSVATAYTSGLAAGLLADTSRPMNEVLSQLRSRIGFKPPASPIPAPTPAKP